MPIPTQMVPFLTDPAHTGVRGPPNFLCQFEMLIEMGSPMKDKLLLSLLL